MSEEENIEKGLHKVSYDARLKYYDVIGKFMTSIAYAQINEDNHLLRNSLNGLLAMVQPYIKNIDKKKIKDLIKESKKYSKLNLGHLSTAILNNKETELLGEACDEIYDKAKHLMLPSNEDVEEEFDEETFFKGSDL